MRKGRHGKQDCDRWRQSVDAQARLKRSIEDVLKRLMLHWEEVRGDLGVGCLLRLHVAALGPLQVTRSIEDVLTRLMLHWEEVMRA